MATWNANFRSNPLSSDTPTRGDDEIQATRQATDERMKNEHTTYLSDGTNGTAAKDWLHKPGSAVAFYQSSAPTTKLSGEALEDGMIWIDSDDGIVYIRHGSAWVGANREIARVSIQGTLSTGTNVVPPIVFPRASTINKVSARVGTAPTGASLLVDFNKYNTSEVLQGSIFDGETRITIAASDYHDARTDFHATYGVLAADEYLTMDIDQVGSTVAGADLSVTIEVLF
jgi:hypothetical protein